MLLKWTGKKLLNTPRKSTTPRQGKARQGKTSADFTKQFYLLPVQIQINWVSVDM